MIELSFREIVERLNRLELPHVDWVVGIGSGGVVPASLVASRIGCELKILPLNYRNESNEPQHAEPCLIGEFEMPSGIRSVLLVDDVSVSGKTLAFAKQLFHGYHVKTCVLKGKADYVAFPEIEDCVEWPWQAHVHSVTKAR